MADLALAELPIAVVAMDDNRTIVYTNHCAAKAAGMSPEAFAGKKFWDVPYDRLASQSLAPIFHLAASLLGQYRSGCEADQEDHHRDSRYPSPAPSQRCLVIHRRVSQLENEEQHRPEPPAFPQ